MKDSTQEENYKYFLENQNKLIKDYAGKFIAIKNKDVIGVFDDQVTAYTETSKANKPGSFIIQQATPESTDAQVFHSRINSV